MNHEQVMAPDAGSSKRALRRIHGFPVTIHTTYGADYATQRSAHGAHGLAFGASRELERSECRKQRLARYRRHYSGPSDSRLARDVWALQVAQWWLSDGNAFSNYAGQAGARSRWGGSSSLPASVVTNLATVLPG